MKRKIILTMMVLLVGIGSVFAQSIPFNETFEYVKGDDSGTMPLDENQLDNPNGWTFVDAFAGPQCVIIKKGGSVTLPALSELTGNASFSFDVGRWDDPNEDRSDWTDKDWGEYEASFNKSHALSISGGGTLNSSEYSGMSAMDDHFIYDCGPQTRLTLTAAYDLMLSRVFVDYGGFPGWGDLTGFSHEPGKYYHPIDLELTKYVGGVFSDDGSHNILVYTLDGSKPLRTSTRYDGTPIHLEQTTTVRTATILGNGALHADEPRTYTFPTAFSGGENLNFPDVPEATFEVAVPQPGGLRGAMAQIDADLIEGVRISGKLNSEDLKYLNEAEGRFHLRYIDLEEATFDYDGQAYSSVVFAPPGGMGHTTYYTYVLTEEEYETRTGSRPDATYYQVGSGKTLAALFHNNSTVEYIVFPKCLERVGSYFGGGYGIQAVKLHDGVKEICDNAFDNSRFRNIPLTAINLPSGIRRIGHGAFSLAHDLCAEFDLSEAEEIGVSAFSGTRLVRVTLGDKLQRLGAGAFRGTKLYSIELPDQLEEIGESTFEGCEDLAEVKLPANLRRVGGRAFVGTPWLAEIAPEGNIRYVLDTPMEVADRTLSEYTVREGTTTVPSYLFSELEHLKTVHLPEGLEEIGREAFRGSSLESITLPSSLRLIDDEAFAGTRLSRITIPELVDSIGVHAFYCDKLWNLTYNAIHARCARPTDWRSSFPASGQLERVTLGDKVEYIPFGIYTGNKIITSIELPASVREIAASAFSDCPKLATLNLNDHITAIGDNAFSGCSSLADIRWPLHLRSIGDQSFMGCSSLSVISLPEGTQHIGSYAFHGCQNVHTLYVPSTIESMGDVPFDQFPKVKMNLTFMGDAPLFSNWYDFGVSDKNMIASIKVPAASLDAYKAAWPDCADKIVPIGQMEAPTENTSTDFAAAVDDDTDLSDTFVGDTYVSLGEEDGFDAEDGALILGSTMTGEEAAALDGLEPGKSDIANRFNGIVVMVGPGYGSVVVNCLTMGARKVAVKIGDQEPQLFTVSSKGDISVGYDVTEATCVYIYGTAEEPAARSPRMSRAAQPDNCIKLYSVSVKVDGTGIEDILMDGNSEITEWYTLKGIRIAKPAQPGIYIIRRADGTTAKVSL